MLEYLHILRFYFVRQMSLALLLLVFLTAGTKGEAVLQFGPTTFQL